VTLKQVTVAALLDDVAVVHDDDGVGIANRRESVRDDKARAAMAKLRHGRTSFVIAHRLSTIRDADTIIVMDHGHIIEQGSHRDLLERHGFYYSLYNSQFTEATAS